MALRDDVQSPANDPAFVSGLCPVAQVLNLVINKTDPCPWHNSDPLRQVRSAISRGEMP